MNALRDGREVHAVKGGDAKSSNRPAAARATVKRSRSRLRRGRPGSAGARRAALLRGLGLEEAADGRGGGGVPDAARWCNWGASGAESRPRGADAVLRGAVESDPFLAMRAARSGGAAGGHRHDPRAADAMLVAAEKGDIATVRRLLVEGVDPGRCAGLRGHSPLHHAAARGHLAVAAALLDAGAGRERRTDAGESPAHMAAYNGKLLLLDMLLDPECDKVETEVEAEADVEAGAEGSSCGDDAACAVAANADAANEDGETPLFYATRRGHAAVVRLLLWRGARPTAENRYGDRPIDEAEPRANASAAAVAAAARVRHEFAATVADVAALDKPGKPRPRDGGADGDGPWASNSLAGEWATLPSAAVLCLMRALGARDASRASCVCGRWHGISQAPSLWAWFGVRRWDLALVLERRRSAKAALEAEEVRAGEEAASESEIDARSQPKGPIGVGSALAAARARRASARKSVDSDGSDGDT